MILIAVLSQPTVPLPGHTYSYACLFVCICTHLSTFAPVSAGLSGVAYLVSPELLYLFAKVLVWI